MEKLKPIKRSKELAPLSREHHDGLMLVWKIRRGLKNGIELERIWKYVQFFYQNSLRRHFEIEEEYVFSLLPHHNMERKEAEAQHLVLRRQILEIGEVAQLESSRLVDFSDLLERHIRFEERILFPLIEKEADSVLFSTYGKMLIDEEVKGCAIYKDEFWH